VKEQFRITNYELQAQSGARAAPRALRRAFLRGSFAIRNSQLVIPRLAAAFLRAALSGLVAALWFLAPAFAGTHVTATYGLGANPSLVTTVNGTAEYGLVFVKRNEPVTWNGSQYGTLVAEGYLDANGALNDGAGNLYLDLVPNTTATPSGSYYVATVNIQGQVHSEIWLVPDQTTVDATLIRQSETPAGGASAANYQMIENAGTALAQRESLNFAGTGVSCADNAAMARTDCTITGGSGGGGTVTSFSAGGLAPLFAASVANPTTTPALSFSLSNASAHSFLGNNTGAPEAPAYVQPAFSDLSGTVSDAQLAGAYSGIGACAAHQWANSLARNAAPTCAQPAYNDLTGTPQLSQSFAAVPHEWLTSYDSATGNFAAAQPDYSDLTGAPALPVNTSAATHEFFTAYESATGAFTEAQPAFGDLSGTAADAQLAGAYSGVGACAADTWASSLSRNAVPTCTQPDFSNLSGTATASQLAIANPTGAELSGLSSENLAAANKTIEKSIVIFTPGTADSNMVQIYFGQAVTLARIACSTDVGTVSVNFDARAESTPNTPGTNVLSSALSCTTTTGATTAFASSGLAADSPLNLQIASVSGTPGAVRIHVKAAIN
jgi:hypothetical protein